MNTSTKALILIVCMQCAATGAMMSLHMVIMWQDTAHGLNPWIGIPIAIFISLAPYVVWSLWFESDSTSDRHNTDTITLTGEDKHAIRTAAGISKAIDSGSSDFPKDVF